VCFKSSGFFAGRQVYCGYRYLPLEPNKDYRRDPRIFPFASAERFHHANLSNELGRRLQYNKEEMRREPQRKTYEDYIRSGEKSRPGKSVDGVKGIWVLHSFITLR
jgi:hypothetical protein